MVETRPSGSAPGTAADEPLSALDAKTRLSLREEIRGRPLSLREETRRLPLPVGITTVFVTCGQEALSTAGWCSARPRRTAPRPHAAEGAVLVVPLPPPVQPARGRTFARSLEEVGPGVLGDCPRRSEASGS
ncbi:hypothetical protein [Streptomyces sp. DH8]|uniref:hypothetical protein n=1 Tax=Streptomyces sp. DH8 TaxID=2857008 RepID=UPI001E607B11|nr:hypothetical protein [Streptomyces sp. DH8]